MIPSGRPGVSEQGDVLMRRRKLDVSQKPIYDIQTFIKAYSNIEQGVLVEIYRKQNFKYLTLKKDAAVTVEGS